MRRILAVSYTHLTSKQEGGLLEKILSLKNMNRAYKQVKRNKGAGGVEDVYKRQSHHSEGPNEESDNNAFH